jgi:chitinase
VSVKIRKNPRAIFIIVIITIILGLLFGSCRLFSTPDSILPLITPMPEKQIQSFRIVGYLTSTVMIETIPFDKLTHINYAFLLPNTNGTLRPIPDLHKLEKIIELAHEHNVKILVAVGGWGLDAEFEALTSDQGSRTLFVETLVGFITEHNLDGIDIDWEYPDRETQKNFLSLMNELRTSLPPEKLLTAAVVSYGDNGEGIPTESFEVVNYLNIMAYDGSEHSTLLLSQKAIDYWLSRELPQEKLVLGVPFYSRPLPVPYRELVAYNPGAAYRDEIIYQGTKVFYNGIPTIQQKTEMAIQRASGIMIWAIDYDTAEDDMSLVNTIYNTIHSP